MWMKDNQATIKWRKVEKYPNFGGGVTGRTLRSVPSRTLRPTYEIYVFLSPWSKGRFISDCMNLFVFP